MWCKDLDLGYAVSYDLSVPVYILFFKVEAAQSLAYFSSLLVPDSMESYSAIHPKDSGTGVSA
jgi:hypothetical protein